MDSAYRSEIWENTKKEWKKKTGKTKEKYGKIPSKNEKRKGGTWRRNMEKYKIRERKKELNVEKYQVRMKKEKEENKGEIWKNNK